MRTAIGSDERMATLTKVEKAGERKLHRGWKRRKWGERTTSVTKRGRQETRVQAGERKARGNGTTCWALSVAVSLPFHLFSFSIALSFAAIRKNSYLPLWRTCSAPCHRSSSQRRCCDKMPCCRTGIVQRQKGISAFIRARDSVGKRAFRLFFSRRRRRRLRQPRYR